MEGVDIRDRLLAYRADRGWSQARLVEESGVSGATIAHLETGANKRPRRITLMRLAQAFGVSLDDFLSDGPPKAPASQEALQRQETPQVELAQMARAGREARHRALAGATPEQLERYLGDIGKQLDFAERAVVEQESTPEGRAGMVRYAAQLGMLHTEAAEYAARFGIKQTELVNA